MQRKMYSSRKKTNELEDVPSYRMQDFFTSDKTAMAKFEQQLLMNERDGQKAKEPNRLLSSIDMQQDSNSNPLNPARTPVDSQSKAKKEVVKQSAN
jgi:hypothetical protein